MGCSYSASSGRIVPSVDCTQKGWLKTQLNLPMVEGFGAGSVCGLSQPRTRAIASTSRNAERAEKPPPGQRREVWAVEPNEDLVAEAISGGGGSL